MLGLCSAYFSRYGFPGVGISRRDLLYSILPNKPLGAFEISKPICGFYPQISPLPSLHFYGVSMKRSLKCISKCVILMFHRFSAFFNLMKYDFLY